MAQQGEELPFAFATNESSSSIKSPPITPPPTSGQNPSQQTSTKPNGDAPSNINSKNGFGPVNQYMNILPHFYSSSPQNIVQNPQPLHQLSQQQQPQPLIVEEEEEEEETLTFAEDSFVTICESDADNDEFSDHWEEKYDNYRSSIEFEYGGHVFGRGGGDVLSLLLSGGALVTGEEGENGGSKSIVLLCEEASTAAHEAAKKSTQGDLKAAVAAHTRAARSYRDAAEAARKTDVSLYRTLLLLSNTQARSGSTLQNSVKNRPLTDQSKDGDSKIDPLQNGDTLPSSHSNKATNDNSRSTRAPSSPGSNTPFSQQEKLRATIRNSMETKNEADMTDSTFLGAGKATSTPQPNGRVGVTSPLSPHEPRKEVSSIENEDLRNPVDDMLKLEKELQDMDMTLAMGNSLTSLGTSRVLSNPTNHIPADEGSFMVIPGESSSVRSGAGVVGRSNQPQHQQQQQQQQQVLPTALSGSGPTNGSKSKNRLQNILGASATLLPKSSVQQQHAGGSNNPQSLKPPNTSNGGLEASWWGNSSSVSVASQMASSMMSMTSSSSVGRSTNGTGTNGGGTKQLMRLLDSLKTLGDENAALLHEVEEAREARLEVKTAREEMKRFKSEYGKRFVSMKAALEKFRKLYPNIGENNGGKGQANPVLNSDYAKSQSLAELQKRDQTIRKLAADLKKERSESKKKDVALRKYESFYREVKARSAQKAKQREEEERRKQHLMKV